MMSTLKSSPRKSYKPVMDTKDEGAPTRSGLREGMANADVSARQWR